MLTDLLPGDLLSLIKPQQLRNYANAKGWKRRSNTKGKNAIFESVKMGRNQDRWHEFEAIRVPSLIVRGENSKDLSKETFQKMIEKNSHMESVEIPGSGHWVHFDKPDEFIRVIDEFLTKTALKR